MVNATTAAAKRGVLRWGPYAAAVVLTGATLAFRLAIDPWVGNRPLLILFFIPIVISAYWGGLIPGFFATALTGLAVDYYLFPPPAASRSASRWTSPSGCSCCWKAC